ncbi:MAG: T9SS type A sorting domain-containing protein [bacterium]|nr:T9SS type A sorting domain-containing protein [bacterium]
MKKVFFLPISLLIPIIFIFAQWTEPVKIWKYGVAYFQPNASHLFVKDTLGNLHLGWYDTSKDVYFCIRKQRYDGNQWFYDGTPYDQPETGTGYYLLSWMPTLSVDEDGRFLFLWESRQDGNFNIMGRYYDGSLLSSVFQVSFTSSYSWFPKSFYRNNKHHFIYSDDSTGVFNIYYGYFDSLVHTPSNITNSDKNCLNYDFYVYPNEDISIIYTKNRNGYQNLYNKRRISNVWQNENLIFSFSSDVYYPNIISDGEKEFAVFTLISNGLSQLYLSKYLNGVWSTPKLLSDGNYNIYYPTGVILNDKLHLFYVSDSYFYGELFDLVYDIQKETVDSIKLIAHHDTSFIVTPQCIVDDNQNIHLVYILNDKTPPPNSGDSPNDIYWTYLQNSKKNDGKKDNKKPYSLIKYQSKLVFDFINSDIYYLSIYDVSGKTVGSFSCSSKRFTLDYSKFKSGIYFITVKEGDKRWKEKIFNIK